MKISNFFTLLRLLSVPILWVLALLGLRTPFGFLLAFAGLTDAIDGYLARKLNQSSEFGARFDSIADNILTISLVFWVWFLLPDFLAKHWILIGLMTFMFVFNLCFAYVKFKQNLSLHLYSGKAAAVLIFAFVVHAMLITPSDIFFYVMSAVIIISLVEEELFLFTRDKLEVNVSSFFK